MIGQRDHRSYAQVVSQTCGSNFTKNLYSVTDHVLCPNIEASSDTAKIGGLQEASDKKRINRGTPQIGCVHKARVVVNTNDRHTNGLIGLSSYQVRVHFDRAMAMIGRRDHRSYAQVVS